MRIHTLFTLACIVTASFGCSSIGSCDKEPQGPKYLDPCLGFDKNFVGVMKMSYEPVGANDMKAIANETPMYKNFPLVDYEESWYVLPSRNVILCRQNYLGGEWWNFESDEFAQNHKLVQHSGWITKTDYPVIIGEE